MRIVDAGLAVCTFVVPLLMGGRHALGQLVLVAAAFVSASAWLLRQCLRREFRWRCSPAEGLLLAGLALLLMQVAPIGESALARIAPHTAAVLSQWTSRANPAASLGIWSCVSLTPAATRAAIPLLIAYGLLVLVTIQRIHEIADVQRLLGWIALGALCMACFGLVQWATANGKYFWFYESPFSSTQDGVKGSFTNRNHFAQFLALGIGPLVLWLQNVSASGQWRPAESVAGRPAKRGASPLRMVALGIVVFAGLMSLSRGGALAIFVAAAVSVAVCYRAKTLGIGFLLGLGAVALLTVVALEIHGYQRVSDRLGQLTSGSLDNIDNNRGRRTIWAADARAVPDHLLLGSGVGSHAEVYPMYMETPAEREYTHAENSPLQLLLETGIPGLALMLVAIGLCARWCLGALRAAADRGDASSPNQRGQRDGAVAKRTLLCAGAIGASLAANIVHAMTDFVWYVPACTMLLAMMAGCAYRTWQLAVDPHGRRFQPVVLPRALAAVAAVIVMAGGAWIVAGRAGPVMAQIHWDRFQLLEIAAAQAIDLNREQQPGIASQRRDAVELDAAAQSIAELEEVLRWQPDHARANLRMADACLRRFDLAGQASENAMPLSAICDAALAVDFVSREAVRQWLSRSAGDRLQDLDRARRHARRAVSLVPTQGDGYLQLAALSFLDGPGAKAARAVYIAQALAVRPFSGAALFEAGKEASAAGNLPKALDFWRRSFHQSAAHRKELIELLAGRVPVEFFLEGFAPDLDALRMLSARYAALVAAQASSREKEAIAAAASLGDEQTKLRDAFLRIAEAQTAEVDGSQAATLWLEIAANHHQMGDLAAEMQDVTSAVQSDPTSFPARLEMARCLIAAGRFAEAEMDVDWCLQKKPDDQGLHLLLPEIANHRAGRADRAEGESRGAAVIR